jgi:hypothetical protein
MSIRWAAQGLTFSCVITSFNLGIYNFMSPLQTPTSGVVSFTSFLLLSLGMGRPLNGRYRKARVGYSGTGRNKCPGILSSKRRHGERENGVKVL